MKNTLKYAAVLFIVGMFIMNVSAASILKPAKVDQNYTILQTCASCTFVDVTVSNVDGIVFSNRGMISNGSGVWLYTIIPTTISRHDVTGVGDPSGINKSFVTFFEVTPSGKVASTGDSILYSLFSIMIFGVILVLTFFIIAIPSDNEKDDEGFDTKILRIKYVRIVLIFLLYPLLILLLNFLNGLAVNFTALSMFSGILGFLFTGMMTLSWPFTVVMIVWIIIMLIHDTNVSKKLDKAFAFDPQNFS